jgi:hypothetical protein
MQDYAVHGDTSSVYYAAHALMQLQARVSHSDVVVFVSFKGSRS